jgi:hypothetical protein
MRVAIWVAFGYASLASPVLKAPNDEKPTKQSSVSRGCEIQRKSQNGIEYISNVMQVPTISCGKSWSQEGNNSFGPWTCVDMQELAHADSVTSSVSHRAVGSAQGEPWSVWFCSG